MNLQRFRYIPVLAALLCALFCIAPEASAAKADFFPEVLQEIPLKSCEYQYSTGNGYTTASVFYSHALLFQDSSTLSSDLAKASVALSVSAYNGGKVSALLESMNFSPEDNTAVYTRSESGLTLDDCDYVAYTISKMFVPHPITKEPYVIYCVPIQGTPTNLEWFSDFNLGTGETHEGFSRASFEVYLRLKARFSIDGMDPEHRILWLTGHSRGAACANLIAGWFNEDFRDDPGANDLVSPENLFAYTFACPAVSLKADETMSNIFNFNNPGDMVPMLPLADWGYKRYGQTISLDTSKLGFENFKQRYVSVTGVEYAGLDTGAAYKDLLTNTLGSSRDIFNNTASLQLAFDLVSWVLGGKPVPVKDVLARHFSDIPDIYNELDKTISLKTWYTLTNGRNLENQDLIAWAGKAFTTTYGMSDEEFADFLRLNSTKIQELQKKSGVTIQRPANFQLAQSELEKDSYNLILCMEAIDAAMEIFCDENGIILDRIMHAHTQPAYNLWINSMFYGHGGWYGNDSLTSFSLDDYDYFSIGQSCFYDCDGLTEITIPDSVTQIGGAAFAYCGNVSKITLPVDVRYGSFEGTHAETIHYTKGSTGIMPDRTSNDSSCLEHYSYNVKHFIFDEGITHIGAYLCYPLHRQASAEYLETVTFPSTLESIGSYAFIDCSQAVFSEWPEGLTTIGPYTFYNCKQLTSYPKTLTAFPDFCFYNCDGLTEIIIPDTITEIGNGAFAYCNNIRSITLPVDLKYGSSSFSALTSVKTIRYTKGSTGIMPDRTTYDTSSLEYHAYATQNYIFDEGIKHIGAYFSYPIFNRGNASSIKSVTLPSTLESIGDYAFFACTSLYPLTFTGNAPTVGFQAFERVTTTAYYPQHNTTWTGDVRQNYGGRLTWTPLVCTGEHIEFPGESLPPTCAEKGHDGGAICSVCGEILKDPQEVPATGSHSYNAAPTFLWDDQGRCTATAFCNGCSQDLTHACAVSSKTIPATQTQSGSITYTASITLGNNTYTDTMVVTIAPGGHIPDGRWYSDQACHWHVCSVCGIIFDTSEHIPGQAATKNTSQRCTVCDHVLQAPLGLDWIEDSVSDPDSYFWSSSYYAKIMEQYGIYQSNTPQ